MNSKTLALTPNILTPQDLETNWRWEGRLPAWGHTSVDFERRVDHREDCDDMPDRFLTEGGVFTDDQIEGYIDLKREEVSRLNNSTHPVEFDMYYSV